MAEPRGTDDTVLTAALRQAQNGDEQAFRTVYRAVQPRLLRYLRSLVDDQDAQDIASEVWARMVQDLPRFEGDADGFRGWAATIARHRAMDLWRYSQRRRHWRRPLEEVMHYPSSDDPETETLQILASQETLALLNALPADQAEAVLLRVIMGLDSPTAARVLGKRPGAVRVATHRGLKKLAQRLGQYEPRQGSTTHTGPRVMTTAP